MRISCIIPAYNEEALLESCIESIIQNADSRLWEIIVVDNASSDRTSEIAVRKGVKVFYEGRKGLTYARERGRQEAAGEILAFIDADCRMPPGWIEFAERYFEQNPHTVCLSGPPVYYDATRRAGILLQALWAVAPIVYRTVGYMVYGAHFVVRKKALEQAGGFNCSIDFYGEDTEIAQRLHDVGTVSFCTNFRIFTSARRFYAEGFVTTAARYALNFLWPVLFGKPLSTSHKDVR